MNVLNDNEDTHDFVIRHFGAELAAGANLADSAARLRSALPESSHWAVAEVESAFAGGAGPREQPQLATLLRLVGDAGGSRERAFTAYARVARHARPAIREALGGANIFGGYIVALVLILAIVTGVYATFVLPQIAKLFDGFETPLPAFTRMLLGNAWVLVLLFLLMLAALVFYFTWLHRLEKRLVTLQPVRDMLRWPAGLSSWARYYDTQLWMRYQAIFLDAGLANPMASDAAARLAGEPPPGDHRMALLHSAAKLGRQREELEAHLANDAATSLTRFERQRNALSILVRLFIYLIVSAYVVAMYLPIFKIGAIV